MQANVRSHSDESAIRNYPMLLKRYERVLEIGRSLSSTLDLGALLRKIIDAALELTDTEAASILLVDSLSGELRFQATTSQADAMQGLVVPREGSLAGWIVSNGQPLVVQDARSDPRFFRGVDRATEFETRSLLGVPLHAKGKTIGVLEALNKPRPFTADDVDTLQALAGQAAAAIENARLFQQSDLIAEMVHELRTPLASLSASSHLLQRPDLPADSRHEIVVTVQNEVTRLSQLTTEFLDLARLESGRVHFVRAPFDLTALGRECIAQVRHQAAERGISLLDRLPRDLPPITGDRAKIKQVLLNLLTNAVKYNREAGSVTVDAGVHAARCRLWVTDTGRGIPPESLPHVFEKFYRVADSDGSVQGTGLGLAIAKTIVESHRGELKVESQVGVGSTFELTLPVEVIP